MNLLFLHKTGLMFLINLFVLHFLFLSNSFAQEGWNEIETNNPPSERAKHSMVSGPDGGIIMFGGEGTQADLFNDLYIFREEDYTELEPVNESPPPRKYNGFWMIDYLLYIFGGLNSNGEVLGDMHKYDYLLSEWSLVNYPPSMSPRYSSWSVLIGSYDDSLGILIGGGQDNNKATLYDTWLFDPVNSTFERKADCPFPSYDQRVAAVDDKAYLLQMHGNQDKMTYYDFNLDTWVIFEPDMNSPSPLWLQSAAWCNAGDNGMFVIGGETYIPGEGYQISDTVWQFTPENHKWTVYGHLPVKLKFLSAAYDTQNDRIIIFGGIDENGNYTNKTYELRFTPVSVEKEDNLPTDFVLEQNYPNPFNPNTTIRYTIPEASNIVLKIYDVLGTEVKTLVNEEKSAGNYSVNFDASGLPSGIYFYRLQTGSFVKTKSMVLLK